MLNYFIKFCIKSKRFLSKARVFVYTTPCGSWAANNWINVFAPNVFTPDSDRANSFFTLFTSKSAVLVRKMVIYDRWGSLIFLRENILPGNNNLRWDGTTASGKQAPEGVYIWMAEVLFTDNVSSIIEGDITLIR